MHYTGRLTQAIDHPSLNKRYRDKNQGGDSHSSIEEASLHGMIENLHSEFQRKKLALNGQLYLRT
jgi:hypothetical protein